MGDLDGAAYLAGVQTAIEAVRRGVELKQNPDTLVQGRAERVLQQVVDEAKTCYYSLKSQRLLDPDDAELRAVA